MKNCTMIIPKTTSSLIQELFKEFPLKKLENYSEIEEKIKEIRDSSEDEIQVTKTKLEEEAIRSQKEKLNGQRNIQTYYGIAAINKISKLQSLLGRSIRLALLHPKLWKEKINFNTKKVSFHYLQIMVLCMMVTESMITHKLLLKLQVQQI